MVKKKTTAGVADKDKQHEEEALTEIEQAIAELRARAKKDDSVDVNKELRKIQDQIADKKGVARRPITAKPDVEEEEDMKSEDEEEEDPDSQAKELINKRLTTCMLLALSYESNDEYPKDFYEKLAESGKFEEVVQPFSKEEIKELNELLKGRKAETKQRVDKAKQNQLEPDADSGNDDEKDKKEAKNIKKAKAKKSKK